MPQVATHRIALPAPNKGRMLALLQLFAANPGRTGTMDTDSGLAPSFSASSGTTDATSTNQNGYICPGLSTPLATFAFELLSEFLTREKRENMRAEKWFKSGRKTVSRDIDELEDRMCFAPAGASGGQFAALRGNSSNSSRKKSVAGMLASGQVENQELLPVFELLRRIYLLEPRGGGPLRGQDAVLPPGLQPVYLPEMDEPYLPPTVQTITSALYVSPPLPTVEAVEVIMELVDHEKDLRLVAVQGAMNLEGGSASGGVSNPRGMSASSSAAIPDVAGALSGPSSLSASNQRSDSIELRRRESEDAVIGALAWGPLEKSKMGKVLDLIERRVS